MNTVLITGAFSGIGRQTAILFSQKGWNVAAADMGLARAEPLADNIKSYTLDIRDRSSVDRCVAQVLSDFGRVDAIVNNAGVYSSAPLECMSDESVDNIIQTNISGVLYMIRAILPSFRENGAGVIVNLSSVLGRVTLPFQSVYHTSKWAVEGLSESLYYELKNLNIKVKLVEPGVVRTNLYSSVLHPVMDQYPAVYRSNFERWHTCLMEHYKNGYSPDLVAKTVFRAVSDNSSKLRYTSDLTTKMMLCFRAMLPISLFRRVIYSMSKLK